MVYSASSNSGVLPMRMELTALAWPHHPKCTLITRSSGLALGPALGWR
jgi:hypothetical protein